MHHCLSVTIVGKVQGVGFRYWFFQRAVELGLKGWVKNCPDGSVLAWIEGEQALIQQLIHECSKGPPSARVERITTTVQPYHNFVDFQIRF